LGGLFAAQIPDLTSEEAIDLVLLRKNYGISAREAYFEIPEWEVELLLAALPERNEAELDEETEPLDDPWAAPPQELTDLLD